MDQTSAWAAATAEALLAPLGRRLHHVRAVGRLADRVGSAFGPQDHSTLVAAAYLHDIGYAPELAGEGFHPLDGARYVRAHGHERIARLVAHHSGARFEAELRGYDEFLGEFPYDGSQLHLALTYCDLTTSPDGHRISLEERVAEVSLRYGPEHVTARAIRYGWPEFEHARAEVESRVEGAAQGVH